MSTFVESLKCRKCGCGLQGATNRGAYFVRVSPKGEDAVWQCEPSCDWKHGGQDDAILAAIKDNGREGGDG